MTDIIVTGIVSILSGMFGAAIGAAVTGSMIYFEAKQNRKIDSIIGAMNGTGEIKEATGYLSFLVIKLGQEIATVAIDETNVTNNNNLNAVIRKTDKAILEAEKEFREYSKESKNVISKFILTLKKDMIINEEDEEVRQVINKIMAVYNGMLRSIVRLTGNEIAIAIATAASGGVVAVNNFDALKVVLKYYNEINGEEEIEESIKTLWDRYEIKLKKVQESFYRKLWNCLCKLFNYFINCFCKYCKKLWNCFINCFCKCCECLNNGKK